MVTERILMKPKKTSHTNDYKVTRSQWALSILHSRRGTSYLEYLIAAAAMAAAVIWLWDDGDLRGARVQMDNVFDAQRAQIVN